MGAIGYTSGDPNKVNVVGDTMTGDLILSGATTDLTVGGVITDTYQGVTGDVMRLLTATMSTGVTSGGLISKNVNPAQIDISATTGWVYTYNSTGTIGPTNPQLTYVSYPGATGIVPVAPPGVQIIFQLIDSAGNHIQQATPPTRAQYRTHLVLGFAAVNGGFVAEVRSSMGILPNPEPQYFDLTRSLGAFSTSNTDNLLTPNGVNLSFNTTGGGIFFPGSNAGNPLDPHVTTVAAQSPVTFTPATATLIQPFTSNVIDVSHYDPAGAGAIVPIPGGANTSTIFRVYVLGAAALQNQIFVQYGQTAYASLTAARDAIGSTNYIVNPAFFRQALAGWIAVTKTATNLSDPTQAIFVRAAKFDIP